MVIAHRHVRGRSRKTQAMRPFFATLASALALLAGCAAPASAGPKVPERPPISHVIEIMLENHTFDDLFAHFPGARGVPVGTTLPSPTPGRAPVAPLLAGPNQGEVQAGLNNSRVAELAMMDRRGAGYAMDGYTRYPGEGLAPSEQRPLGHLAVHGEHATGWQSPAGYRYPRYTRQGYLDQNMTWP